MSTQAFPQQDPAGNVGQFNRVTENAAVEPVSPDENEIRRAVDLLYPSGGIVEMRVPRKIGTISGYYDMANGGRERLVFDAVTVSDMPHAANIYTTIQELNLGMPAGRENRFITRAAETTKDNEVTRYTQILIDADPVRDSKVSATDEEKAYAFKKANECREWLRSQFGIQSILADSGNGIHQRIPVDLPNTPENVELVRRVLLAISARFTDDRVVFDTTVFNPARICKLYGTVARKGENTAERPHRLSRVLDVPANLKIVPREILQKIAGEYVFEPHTVVANADNETLSAAVGGMKAFLDHFGINFYTKPSNNSQFEILFILEPCPRDETHTGSSPAITIAKSGQYGFTCKHNGCAGVGWKELRKHIDPDNEFKFPRPPSEWDDVAWDISAPVSSSVPASVPKAEIPECIVFPFAKEPEPPTIAEILGGQTIYTDNAFGAKVFHARYGRDYLFSVTTRKGEWMKWNGQFWIATNIGALRTKCTRITADIRKLLASKDGDERKIYALMGKLFSDGKYVAQMLKFLEGECGASFSDFDGEKSKNLFNFANGTYDLETQTFRKFERGDLITQIASAAYKPDARCPTWERFLENSFPLKTTRDYLQRFFGYAMTATGVEKAAPILHGLGDNGKTVMLDVLVAIFGMYAQFCSWSTFAVSKYGGSNIRNDLARLYNARLVVCDESSKNMELDEATFKAATGNSTVVSRFLNKEYFEYVAGYKLVLATNNRPKIACADRATWARIHDVEMERSFPKGSEGRIENLKSLLMSERDGIAAWLVRGHSMWVSEGLNPPAEILASTARYQEHSDIQSEFFNSCPVGSDLSVRLGYLYKQHCNWMGEIGERELTQQDFQELVESRGFKVVRKLNERGRPDFIRGLGASGAFPTE